MERIQHINPDRIQWCCDDHGIALDQLAEKLKISLARFKSVMAGEGGLTFKQLRKVARFFNRGALFFLDSTPVIETQVRTPQFRTIASQKPDLSADLKALIERVERHRDIYLSLREDLGEEDSPQFNPPELPRQNPKRAAEVARKWLNLGEQNDFSSYREAVEAKDILVFRSQGYAGAWQIPNESQIIGFQIYHPKCPAIVIKKLRSEPRQSFTLMHELGHVLLHRNSFIDDEENLYNHEGREQKANAFAGHLLVPDAFLGHIRGDTCPSDVEQFDAWLEPHRKKWGVSGEVILRRLLDSGRLDQTSYQAYRDWWNKRPKPKKPGGSRKYRHREPLHIFGGQFVRTVFDALHTQQVSLSKASTYLDNLKIKKVHELGNYIASL